MIRWALALIFGGLFATTPALADEDARLRVSGATLQDFEQQLFGSQGGQQGGLAQGTTPFDARFRGLSLTQADRQRLLADIQQLNQISEGSRVLLGGTIVGRHFTADVRNHKGELDVRMNGIQFGSREEAQTFIDSLRQGGADRIQVKGTINGQHFHASFRTHNGRVEQRFQIKEPKDGTLVTTGTGRSHVAGGTAKAEVKGEHGRTYDDDHGAKSLSGSGSSPKSGHGSRGKD